MSFAVVVVYYALLVVLALFGLRRAYLLLRYYLNKARIVRPWSEPLDDDALPMITVQLPIFNEVHVAARLLEVVSRLDWPRDLLDIQVLDDSTDETRELIAREVARHRAGGLAIHHLRRDSREGYKAGALAAGLTVARGDFVAIFDADFMPAPSFLRQTVPFFFADPTLGFVQGGWEHVNREHSLLTRVQAILLDAHFRFEHTVRSLSGYFVNFTGTGGVWRVRAIEGAGGWQHDTLIEDADLAYRAHLAGWRGLHLPDLLCASELPEDPSAWRGQQQRWAKGNAQVMRKLLPAILRSRAPWGAKVECFLHLSSNCVHPVNLLLALLFVPSLAARRHGWLVLDASLFAFSFVSVGAYFALSQLERPGMTFRSWLRELRVLPSLMALGMGASISQSRAVVVGFFGRDLVFDRTPKSGRERRPRQLGDASYRAPMSRMVLVEGVFALGYALAIGIALYRRDLWSLPFLFLFFHGFFHVAWMSVRESLRQGDGEVAT